MQTITVTIDKATVEAIDRLVESSRDRGASRSALVREALHEFLRARAKRETERREAEILAANREQLEREAAALIEDQAAP